MEEKAKLTLVHVGGTARLERLLPAALADVPLEDEFWVRDGAAGCAGDELAFLPMLAGRRVLFLIGTDAWGPGEDFYRLLRGIRAQGDCLDGAIAGIVVDGVGECYTKQCAQQLALAANQAGCLFPGKPLVEGTGSLYNQHILAGRMGLSWEETYRYRMGELARLVLTFSPPRFERPRLLVLHASDNQQSNTVWMGRQVVARLSKAFACQEISLQNGTIQDCRGCSFTACLHFAQQNTCFYGGAISEEVLPAIEACDAMLMLCPNYNDAVSANMMALFNRLTNLLTKRDLCDKYLFGIVVSGYSGSDLVAQQLLGAMCFNKTVMLPPHFCLMETAHDPGSASRMPNIEAKLDAFAANIEKVLRDRASNRMTNIKEFDRMQLE